MEFPAFLLRAKLKTYATGGDAMNGISKMARVRCRTAKETSFIGTVILGSILLSAKSGVEERKSDLGDELLWCGN
jgi:hypothetical protein